MNNLTNEQRTNLEILLAAVHNTPEANFDLDNFRQDTPCGTLFCTVGIACTLPRFEAMGFRLVPIPTFGELPPDTYRAYVGDAPVAFTPATDEAFGEDAYRHLFSVAGTNFDRDYIGYDDDEMTDKELAIARLRYRLATWVVAE